MDGSARKRALFAPKLFSLRQAHIRGHGRNSSPGHRSHFPGNTFLDFHALANQLAAVFTNSRPENNLITRFIHHAQRGSFHLQGLFSLGQILSNTSSCAARCSCSLPLGQGGHHARLTLAFCKQARIQNATLPGRRWLHQAKVFVTVGFGWDERASAHLPASRAPAAAQDGVFAPNVLPHHPRGAASAGLYWYRHQHRWRLRATHPAKHAPRILNWMVVLHASGCHKQWLIPLHGHDHPER